MESNVNRNYKNSVFSLLFSSPDVLRELYSAIEGVDVPKETVININTLTEVFFMNQINDISFTIDDRIVVLIEHQSTINNNMPVRFLMYIGRVYEKIIENKRRYKEKLIKIPTPEFIVLYNGKTPYPDYNELRLSHAFNDAEKLMLPEKGVLPLELVVKVYNINHGKNPQIINKSEILGEYSLFNEIVDSYKRKKSLEEPIKNAIEYCIEHNILRDFLIKHASEVINMLMGEWNLDDAMEVWREEAIETGMEIGIEQGIKQGIEQGIEKGIEQGIEQGIEKGIETSKLAIARKLLAEGSSLEFIQKITELDLMTIKKLIG